MKLEKTVERLMKDKNVMYVLLVVSVLNVLQYLMNEQFESTIFFCAVGFLTAYFSKNMSVVMLTAIVATLLFRQSNISTEGFKEGVGQADGEGDGEAHDTPDHHDKSKSKNGKEDDQKHREGTSDNVKKNDDKSNTKDDENNPTDDNNPTDENTIAAFTNRKIENFGGATPPALPPGAQDQLAHAEGMLKRLESMMGKLESFGGMFGGKK